MSKLNKPQLVALNAELSAANAQLRADVQRLTNQLEAERTSHAAPATSREQFDAFVEHRRNAMQTAKALARATGKPQLAIF